MNTDEAMDRLDDYLDGRLSEAARDEIDRLLAADAELRADLEFLKRVRSEAAALPRRLEPERDLWPQISSRLGQRRRGTIDFGRYRSRQRVPLGRYVVAAAALVLFALGAPLLLQPAPAPAPQVPAPSAANDRGAAEADLEHAAAEYRAARDQLLIALDQRRADLSPETLAVVEENLALIATAVGEIEVALAVEPDSPRLERMLLAAYQREVNLLKQAVHLRGEVDVGAEPDSATGENDEA